MARRRRKKQTKQPGRSAPASPECNVAVSPFSEMELEFFRRGEDLHAPIHEVHDESSAIRTI